MNIDRVTGVAVPLGALYTENNTVIGEFADLIPFSKFCRSSGLKIIQLLPVNDTGTQSSPYSGLSAFALHPLYIRIKDVPGFSELYKSDGDFANEYDSFIKKNGFALRFDYDDILNGKISLLQKLYKKSPEYSAIHIEETVPNSAISWIEKNPWVKIYAVYKNLKWKYMQASWKEWPEGDKNKSIDEIEKAWNDRSLLAEHFFYVWCQMIAEEQFSKAVEEVHKNGIVLKGDMPILMNEDSCDVWAFPNFFNQDLRAGSPSDGENPEGQNWGFPTYNWKNLKTDNYSWWINRLKSAEKYYDAYRLDHILGFFRIWAVPSKDVNALNGHAEPCAFIKKDELYELGFDDDRIRWLSKPHVPTQVIEDITWNREVAHKMLECVCDRIGNEELWLFKPGISGNKDIVDCDFKSICDENGTNRIKEKLVEYWSNRTLLEIARNKFVPLWTYGQSTSWGTLSENERLLLSDLFDGLNKKNERLWKKNAAEILEKLTSSVNMIPCGEDLGVGIKCVPEIMKSLNILGLRVVRWCRQWDKENQPYIDFEDYEPLSITTTSVHDSSTMREWMETEFSSAKEVSVESHEQKEPAFSEEKAFKLLSSCASSQSVWFIPPLQDFLYMNRKYWLEKSEDERINVPGTVTKFNWTYRMPVSLEKLMDDAALIEKINCISKRDVPQKKSCTKNTVEKSKKCLKGGK